MADISRIKLPNGVVYDIKDTEVRKGLELLLGKQYINEGDNKNSEDNSEE